MEQSQKQMPEFCKKVFADNFQVMKSDADALGPGVKIFHKCLWNWTPYRYFTRILIKFEMNIFLFLTILKTTLSGLFHNKTPSSFKPSSIARNFLVNSYQLGKFLRIFVKSLRNWYSHMRKTSGSRCSQIQKLS